jgi:hypothetical protein
MEKFDEKTFNPRYILCILTILGGFTALSFGQKPSTQSSIPAKRFAPL